MTTKKKTVDFAGYAIDIPTCKVHRQPTIDLLDPRDHGYDILEDGKFRMVPSGRVVTLEQARAILAERGL